MMRKALGRGLDALIPTVPAPSLPEAAPAAEGVYKVPINKIRANHLQPRKYFDPERLSELAASIKEHGLAQPLVVSVDSQTNTYELIAGERRWRASQLAGLTEVEVVVRSPKTEKDRLAIALVENLQREDLNAIEQALGYLRLMKEFQINQTELTSVVGKSKSAISNTLRLLELPEDIQKAVEFGQLTEGHARALLMVKDPIQRHAYFKRALSERLSVRELENLAHAANGEEPAPRPRRKIPAEKSPDIAALEDTLRKKLGTKSEVVITKEPHAGYLKLHFYSLDELEKILNSIVY